MNLNPLWKNVFAHSNDKSLKEHFNELGQDLYNLYTTLSAKDPIEFKLTQDQMDEHNAFFARMQDKYLVLQGLDSLAIIQTMVRHSSYIVSQLPEEVKTEKRGNKKERFFVGPPEKFTHNDFVVLAKSLNIAERKAVRYISVFCDKGLIRRDELNSYTNLQIKHSDDKEMDKNEGS